MNPVHEPNALFLENLEWQLRTHARRQQRFYVPPTQSWTKRHLVVGGIALASLLMGMFVSSATAQLAARSHRDVLLAKWSIKMQLIDTKLGQLRQEMQRVQQRLLLGLAAKSDSSRAALDVALVALEKRRLELDQQEILLTSATPQNDLSTPQRKDRDFVSERLQLDIEELFEKETVLKMDIDQMKTRFRIGLVSALEVDSRIAELDQLHFTRICIDEKLKARAAFCRGRLSAKNADISGLVAERQRDNAIAQVHVEILEKHIRSLENRVQVGTIPVAELDQARAELANAQAEAKLAEFDAQHLRQKSQQQE